MASEGGVAKFPNTMIPGKEVESGGPVSGQFEEGRAEGAGDYWKGDYKLGLRGSPEFCPAGVVPAAVRNESTRSRARCTSRSRPGNTKAQARPSRRW